MPVSPLELRNRVIKATYQVALGVPGIVFADTITPVQMGFRGVDTGLKVDFDVNLHVQQEPQSSHITVWGVATERALSIQTAFRQARALAFQQREQLRAGRIQVIAGYEKNFGLLFDHDILNVKIDTRDNSITFECQDGRAAWENSFVGATLPGGTPLSIVQNIVQSSITAGKTPDADFQTALVAGLQDYQLASGNVAGTAELGLLLLGQTKEVQKPLNDMLNLKQIWQNGYPVTIRTDSAKLGPPVLLGGPGGHGLLNATTIDADGLRGPGWVETETLLLPQLEPGRQVLLRDETGAPRYGGVFRVDNVTHRGERSGNSWNSTAVLRPTAIA